MSCDQYSCMRQQFCGVNDYRDVRGSIYPKIKIMAVWRQIHHSGHTPPCNHDLPQLCDFPDVANRPFVSISSLFSYVTHHLLYFRQNLDIPCPPEEAPIVEQTPMAPALASGTAKKASKGDSKPPSLRCRHGI